MTRGPVDEVMSDEQWILNKELLNMANYDDSDPTNPKFLTPGKSRYEVEANDEWSDDYEPTNRKYSTPEKPHYEVMANDDDYDPTNPKYITPATQDEIEKSS